MIQKDKNYSKQELNKMKLTSGSPSIRSSPAKTDTIRNFNSTENTKMVDFMTILTQNQF